MPLPETPEREPPPLLPLALLSAGALAYEVLLMRLYAYIQWQHFTPVVISLALLGFGASGSVLHFAAPGLLRHFRAVFAGAAALFGVTALGAFAGVQALPFNPLELLWDPQQALWMVSSYLLLSVPFFFAGGAIGLTLMRHRRRLATVYAWDLAGAGVGAAGVVVLLLAVPLQTALGLVCALGPAAAALAPGPGARRLGALLLLAAMALAGAGMDLRPSPYKGLSTARATAGARVAVEAHHPMGTVTAVENDRVPLRHAPGMSLLSPALPPPQVAVFVDGDALLPITRFTGETEPLGFLRAMPSALPYALTEAPRVLILGAGTGLGVLQALVHGASAVDAVEAHPLLPWLTRGPYREFSGDPFGHPRVRLFQDQPRGFLHRGDSRYHLIQTNTGGASTAGGTAVNHQVTVETLAAALGRLEDDGLLAVNVPLRLPPRASLKLLATARKALVDRGTSDPGRHLVWVRGPRHGTLLVAPTPLRPDRLEAVREFSRRWSFDQVHLPGMTASEANRRLQVRGAPYRTGAEALLGPEAGAFTADYPYDIRPASDDRPFFDNFFRWQGLARFLELPGGAGRILLDAGYLVLVLALVQAAVLGLLLVALPLTLGRRRGPGRAGGSFTAVYFTALGLGFLALEIAFLEHLNAFLADPVLAAAIGLGAFLVGAGLGSRWTERRESLTPTRVGLVVAAVALLYGLFLGDLLTAAAPAAQGLRVAVALGAALPLAFVLGLPFPAGLRALARRSPQGVPGAWAVNGAASVAAAPGAALLALHWGFSRVFFTVAGLYLVAALAGRWSEGSGPGSVDGGP